jgi:hypothetical protein
MTTNPYESPENPSELPRQPAGWARVVVSIAVVVGILGLLVALLLPATRAVPEAGRRMQCSNHLQQIAIGLQNYADTYGCLPPAYTVDAEGKRLHSWRTLILPFVEQRALHDQIDFSKPWDDPANEAVRNAKIPCYVCPSGRADQSQTTYFAVVAPGGCFQATEGRPIAEITDNKNETLMVVEVSEKYAVHWMSPTDATEEMIVDRQTETKFSHANGSLAAFVDGHTGFLSKNTPANIIRALISISGGEKVGEY